MREAHPEPATDDAANVEESVWPGREEEDPLKPLVADEGFHFGLCAGDEAGEE